MAFSLNPTVEVTGEGDETKIACILCEVYDSGVCHHTFLCKTGSGLSDFSKLAGNGLSTARVGDADELFYEISMLIMIPVTKDDSELFIIRMDFGWRVQH